uniref:Uncharacterized protein n=1 Tax=Chenopodium quinoa TaxID=63459 RepID=A0A803MTP1_CHEQI
MYRYYQCCHDQAETKFKKCDDERQAAANEREKLKVDIKVMENHVSELKTKLDNQEAMMKKIVDLEQQLNAEKEAKVELEGKLKRAEEEKPGIRRRTVNRFPRFDHYRNMLVDRYTGGWVSAHRCMCKAEKWNADKWQAAETAYADDMHLSPTSYEGDYFDDPPPLVILKNTDPRDMPEEVFDDALIANATGEERIVGDTEAALEKEAKQGKD